MKARRIYTAQEMRDVAQCLHYNSPSELTIEASAMLRQAVEMRERCKVLLEDIVKCKSHHTGICPAYTGEIISYWNCPKDKPCAKAVIIKELRALLCGNAGKEDR